MIPKLNRPYTAEYVNSQNNVSSTVRGKKYYVRIVNMDHTNTKENI